METSIQNGALAAGYALLFFLLLRHPLKRGLRCMLIACAAATIYNLAYDSAIHFRIVSSIALFIRVLPPIEAAWRCRRDCRIALTLLVTALGVRTFSPEQLAAGYLANRNAVTISVTIVCIMMALANHFEIAPPEFYSKHMTLQTLWMVAHSAFSVSSPFYNATWPRRAVARWLYVAVSLCLVLAYRKLLTSPSSQNQPVHQAAASESSP